MQYQRKKSAATAAEQEEHKVKERKEFAQNLYDHLTQESQGQEVTPLSKLLGQSHRPNPEDLNEPRKSVPL